MQMKMKTGTGESSPTLRDRSMRHKNMLMFSHLVGDIFQVAAVGSEAFISEEQFSFSIEQMFGTD